MRFQVRKYLLLLLRNCDTLTYNLYCVLFTRVIIKYQRFLSSTPKNCIMKVYIGIYIFNLCDFNCSRVEWVKFFILIFFILWKGVVINWKHAYNIVMECCICHKSNKVLYIFMWRIFIVVFTVGSFSPQKVIFYLLNFSQENTTKSTNHLNVQLTSNKSLLCTFGKRFPHWISTGFSSNLQWIFAHRYLFQHNRGIFPPCFQEDGFSAPIWAFFFKGDTLKLHKSTNNL